MPSRASVVVGDIELLLTEACNIGNRRLDRGDTTYSSDSSKNENFVVEVLKSAASNVGLDPSLISHLGGKAFPDVHILGSGVGIELKGSLRGGAITGNSIFSASMVDDLEKVYLLYWIDDRKPKLGFRDYFECVFDAKVTHSPRFALQVDLPPNESMFGTGSNQLGFAAADWLSGDTKYVEKIVLEIRRRALERDEIPWWVVADPDHRYAIEMDRSSGLGGLTLFENLERPARASLQKTLFLAFPEVLKGGSSSHAAAIGWALSQKSVYITRDRFSSGGRQTVALGRDVGDVELPAVVNKCAEALRQRDPVACSDLSIIFGASVVSGASALKRFESTLLMTDLLDRLFEFVPSEKRKNSDLNTFKIALTKHLVEQLDPSTIV